MTPRESDAYHGRARDGGICRPGGQLASTTFRVDESYPRRLLRASTATRAGESHSSLPCFVFRGEVQLAPLGIVDCFDQARTYPLGATYARSGGDSCDTLGEYAGDADVQLRCLWHKSRPVRGTLTVAITPFQNRPLAPPTKAMPAAPSEARCVRSNSISARW